MRQNSLPSETAEQHIKTIRRATRKKFSTEDKIRIVLSGLRVNTRSPSCAGGEGSRRAYIVRRLR